MNNGKTNKIMSSEELDDVLPKYEPIKLSGKNLAQNYVSAFNTGMNIYQCVNQLQGYIEWVVKAVNDVVKSWNVQVGESIDQSKAIVRETTTEQFNVEWTNKQPELIEQVNTLTTNQFNEDWGVLENRINTTLENQNTNIQNIQTQQTDLANQQTTLSNRMDTFTSLSEGSTTGDAELKDIRVGANGVTYPNAGDAVRGQYNQLKEDLADEITNRNTAINTKISRPTIADNSKFPRANNGDVEWVEHGLPTDAQTESAVTNWLNSHPEATTTVQDNSLTTNKFTPEVRESLNLITSFDEFLRALSESDSGRCFIGGSITITDTIDITEKETNKIFENFTFILENDMFTWTNSNKQLPTFVNCTFIGNGDFSLVKGKKYISGSKFSGCIFNNVSFCKSSTFVQSPKFILCRWGGTTDFIVCDAIYDAVFEVCQWENDWQAKIIEMQSGGAYNGSSQLRFTNCIAEGQTENELITLTYGDLLIENCYFESVNKGIAVFTTPSPFDNAPLLNLQVYNCKFSWRFDNGALFTISDAFINSPSNSRYNILIDNCAYDSNGENQNVLNRYDLPNLYIKNSRFSSNTNRFSFRDTVLDYTHTSDLIKHDSGAQELYVYRFPCLITWASYLGGNHIETILVSKRNDQKIPILSNISNTSSTFALTLSDDESYIKVTGDSIKNSVGPFTAIPLGSVQYNLSIKK